MRNIEIFAAATGLILASVFFGFSQPQGAAKFLVLTIDDKIIGPVTVDYISSGIDEAEREKYAGVILLLDTPGGLLESTRAIVKKIINADVPVITYISPGGSRAGSAGVFITLASHVAAMAPSTNLGAAHPVVLGDNGKKERPLRKAVEELTEALRTEGFKKKKRQDSQKHDASRSPREPSENPMEDKITNDAVAWVTAIAKHRNRNADWAKEAVLESVSATEEEALDKKIIDITAVSLDDLLKKINGRTVELARKTVILNTTDAEIVERNMTLRQNILITMISPNIAYLLMMIGLLGIFIEVVHPGVLFPGVAGVICLILAFYAFAVLPVNFAGFLLSALGIIFFIAEALTPLTFGLLALAGLICILLGSLMLIDTPPAAMRVSLNVILPSLLAASVIVFFLASSVIRAHKKKAAAGPETLIGETGTAETDIEREGQVFVKGELWTAVNASQAPIRRGETIRVRGVDKVKLIVSK